MEWFEVTVINKCMVCITHIYYSDLTEHEHMYTPSSTFIRILQASHCSLSMFNTGVTIRTFITHEKLSISFMFGSFTLLYGHCMYNSCLFMYFPILKADVITASCKHYLNFKWTSDYRNCNPGR